MAASTSFNSEQYTWSDVSIQVGNRILEGVQAVAYKRTQEKGYVYGKGNKPLSIQRGNYSFEGSIKVLQNELQTLQDGAPNKDLCAYRNLTVTVTYQRQDGALTTDNLIGVEFGEVEKAIEQGKQFMEVTLPIMILDIQNGI